MERILTLNRNKGKNKEENIRKLDKNSSIRVKKLRHLGYFPGGESEYASSMKRFLDFVKQRRPSQEEFVEWASESFDLKSKGRINDCIYMLRNLGLITVRENKFKLTVSGARFQDSQFLDIVYNALGDIYLGIKETMEVLSEKFPLSRDEIIASLAKRGIHWDLRWQYNVRFNWLLSLGYVVKNGPLYNVVDKSPGTMTGAPEDENAALHKMLQGKLVEAGENYEHRSFPEYSLDDYRLDVVWIQKNEDIPVIAFEIQLRESDLEKALTRLAYARTKHVYRLVLYTTEELIPKAKRILNRGHPELANFLEIMPLSEIDEEKKASEIFKSHSGKRGGKIRYRKF